MRQNFLISEEPDGEQLLELLLEVEVEGLFAEVSAAQNAINFHSITTEDRLGLYADLHVFDATGRELPAKFVSGVESVSILVDDTNAVYPVLVDPLTSGDTASGQSGSEFGFSVTRVPETSSDRGIVVGAPYYDGGQTNEGAVFYFEEAGAIEIIDSSADWSDESDVAYALLGYDVTGLGDFDNDSSWDLAAGAPNWNGDQGRVYVWEGSGSGFSSTPTAINGAVSNSKFGYSVSAGGNVDADDYDDLIVGAPYTNGTSDPNYYYIGAIHLFKGSSSGISTSSSWSYEAPDNATHHTGELGRSVAICATLDGGSYDDIVAGAPGYNSSEGLVRVFNGTSTVPSSTPSKSIYGGSTGYGFGSSLAGGGDLNDDGYNDLAVGAPDYDNGEANEGGVFAYYGSSTGVSTSADWEAESGQANARMGYDVGMGDLDGDGDYDVLASSPYYDPVSITDSGRVDIWLGGSSGVNGGTDGTLGNADESAISYTDDTLFGTSADFFDFTYFDGIVVGVPGADDVAMWKN